MRRHWAKGATLLGGCATVLSCAARRAPPVDRMVSVGSHRLQVHIEGRGSPAVVIDAGIGDQLDKLRPLQARLAQVTQVITYNRAGYGQSEPGPLPRDAAREAEELRTLLANASVRGPYVLVGHSLGALNVQVFASMHPGDVAGMVLMDPPPLSFLLGRDYGELRTMAEQMTKGWEATADSAARSPALQDQARAAFFRMLASEHRALFSTSAEQADSISTFGDTPLVVFAAGKPNPAFGDIAEEYQRYWIEQSRALSSRSSRGRFILVEGASHYLYQDALDTVASEILAVVADVRRGK